MAATFKTEGIVIKTVDYKEADRLYTILTKDYGKLTLRGQGVRKMHSKLAGHLEPFTCASLFIAKARGFDKIGGAQTLHSFFRLKNDWEKIKAVNYCLAILNDLVLEQNKDEDIYDLLCLFLYWTNKNKINALIVQSFILKLLNLLGLKPDYSKASGQLAKILHFLSTGQWNDIQKLRIRPRLWQQLNLVFNNFIRTNVSANLQRRDFLL